MQSLSTIATHGQEKYAADGKIGAANAALGGDFAAMLGSMIKDQGTGVNRIFSAMQQFRSEKGSFNADIPVKDNKSSLSLEAFGKKDNATADRIKPEKTANTYEDDAEDEDKGVKADGSADDATQVAAVWVNNLLAENKAEEGSELNKTQEKPVNTQNLLKNTVAETKTETVLNEEDLQNYADELLSQEGEALQNTEPVAIKDDSALTSLMVQANVKAVKVSEVKGSTDATAAMESMDDLSFINESLKLASDMSEGEGNTSQNGGQGSLGGNAQQALLQSAMPENKSLGEALSALKQGMNSTASSSYESTESALSSRNETSSIDALTGAAQGLSQTRMSAMENAQASLRSDMLTLSQDVKKNAEEIARAVMTMAAKNLKRFTFELNPHGMGRMEISIDTDESNEAVNVNVAAEEQATRRLIAQSLPTLKQFLRDAGVNSETSCGDYQGGDGHERQGSEHKQKDEREQGMLAGNEDVRVEKSSSQALDDEILSLFA